MRNSERKYNFCLLKELYKAPLNVRSQENSTIKVIV